VKIASAVLRGLGGSNAPRLPDQPTAGARRFDYVTPTKRWALSTRRRLNPAPLCAKKLGVSDRVQVPVGQGLTTHPYRVLQH